MKANELTVFRQSDLINTIGTYVTDTVLLEKILFHLSTKGFPASEVFEAAREDVITNWLNTEGDNTDRKYHDYTDYEKTKI